MKKKPQLRGGNAQPAAPNRFEAIWSRRKFDILGKKQKGEGKRLGQLRSKAIDKRKKTILKEYKQRNRSNAFIDRRFGENDENLDEDQKAILRFKRERQVQMKRQSKFVLPDDDDDILTHKGAALALDDFEDDIPDDDDNVNVNLDDITLPGPPQEGPEPVGAREHKSKKEVMEELIAKSKHYKAVRAKEKEEDSHLREKLDQDLKMLTENPENQALLSLVQPKKMGSLKSFFAKLGDKGSKTEAAEKEAPDDYDKLMKEMSQELRVRASDRTKTADETAKEEKERLEELERKRKKRMLGEDGSESEHEDDEEQPRGGKKKKARTEISGDDLGENFELEPLEQYGLADMDNSDEDGNGDEGDELGEEDEAELDEEDEAGSDEEDEAGSDEEDGDDLNQEDDSMDDTVHTTAVQTSVKPKNDIKQQGQDQELPFVIDAPQNLEQLRQLVVGRPVEELELAIHRIRKCNAISLAAENRKKMQIFYNVLLLYFSEVAGEKPFSVERINTLTKALIEMSSETPYFASVCARERLLRMQDQLTQKIRRGDGSTPSLRVLLFLRLWSVIFPGSDFRHVVMTPLTLLIGEYLMRSTISSGRDVAVGSFLCSLLFSIMKQAKRFCPEALSFLLALLSSGLEETSVGRRNCPQFLKKLAASQPWLRIKDDHSALTTLEPLDFFDTMTTEEDDMFDSDTFRIGIINASLQTLKGFVAIYDDLISFPEVFAPFLPILLEFSMLKVLPTSLRESFGSTLDLMKNRIDEHEKVRQPLRMRLKKPTPIKQFNPKFEESYVKGRDYDIQKERAEKKKLQKQVKQAAKSAARELRKDNQFLAAEKAKEITEAAQEREEKYRKAMAFLEQQEAEGKSGLLGKRSKKKR